MSDQGQAAADSASAAAVVRHSLAARIGHWVMAGSSLILMATAFLPILGFDFAWVGIHWVTGIVLSAAVVFHLLRVLRPAALRRIWIGPRDVADGFAVAAWVLRRSETRPPKAGKYALAQKSIHQAFAGAVTALVVTGLIMLVKVDTPWWERNPYYLADSVWGLVYVLHGLAALVMITLVISHVYFALRPEKRLYLRSMIGGTVSRAEFGAHHDPQRWQVDE